MRRQKDDMQVNVAGFRRNIKNLAHNYSDAQIKVREATSNDPWGPSATIMAEVADLTYNVVAFSEIMQMIWKRLNDHGKNWRHVYKALILLEYLIKTGTEKVAQQCKENIFAIQTLKEFQHQEECNDQGIRVREKAKQLVSLLKDDERLKNERTKALKAKERFAQNASGFGSDGSIDGPTVHRDSPSAWRSETDGAMRTGGSGGSGVGAAAPLEIEYVRPQTVGEEELQLQLAMAMSREEAEQEEAKRRSDDVRLQLALSQSQNDFKHDKVPPKQESHLLDLLDISLGATSISSPTADAWGLPKPAPVADPWASGAHDPWGAGASGGQAARPASSAAALIGGGVGASNVESWLSRTQSPSSGSSGDSGNNAWLQNNGSGYPHPPANNGSSDPWLGGGGAGASGGGLLADRRPASSAAVVDPWLNKTGSAAPQLSSDPWQSPNLNTNGHSAAAAAAAPSAQILDPWSSTAAASNGSSFGNRPSSIGAQMSPSSDLDDFDVITNRSKSAQGSSLLAPTTNSANNNNASLLDELDPLSTRKTQNNSVASPAAKSRTPQSFLGENSALVNLDNLIKPVAPGGSAAGGLSAFGGSAAFSNPFGESTGGAVPKTNLFQQQTQPMPSINQLKQTPFPVTLNQDPWAPANAALNSNPNATTGNASFNNNLGQPPQNIINNNLNLAGTGAMNNSNNNAPWLRPDAAASNPFLS